MTKSSDQTAFPCVWLDHDSYGELKPRQQFFRLTKRELFAVMAMQALYSNPNCHAGPEECAKDACNAADALIAELKK